MVNDSIGSYEERPFLKTRIAIVDTSTHGSKKHHIPVLCEVDVTRAHESIRAMKESTGEGLSFTGWAIKCVAQAVSEHKPVHAMRKGKRALVIFDDVDVSIAVEREQVSSGPSETLPMPYVVRKANEKSLGEIHREIRSAQARPLQAGETYLADPKLARQTALFLSLPQVFRDLVLWRRLAKNPYFAKKIMGTVVVSAVGMFGRAHGGAWGIPIGIHPLVVLLGAIARKPAVVGDNIEIRDILSLTVLFDHDVVDGAPIARFLDRLQNLLESGFGLGERG